MFPKVKTCIPGGRPYKAVPLSWGHMWPLASRDTHASGLVGLPYLEVRQDPIWLEVVLKTMRNALPNLQIMCWLQARTGIRPTLQTANASACSGKNLGFRQPQTPQVTRRPRNRPILSIRNPQTDNTQPPSQQNLTSACQNVSTDLNGELYKNYFITLTRVIPAS